MQKTAHSLQLVFLGKIHYNKYSFHYSHSTIWNLWASNGARVIPATSSWAFRIILQHFWGFKSPLDCTLYINVILYTYILNCAIFRSSVLQLFHKEILSTTILSCWLLGFKATYCFWLSQKLCLFLLKRDISFSRVGKKIWTSKEMIWK